MQNKIFEDVSLLTATTIKEPKKNNGDAWRWKNLIEINIFNAVAMDDAWSPRITSKNFNIKPIPKPRNDCKRIKSTAQTLKPRKTEKRRKSILPLDWMTDDIV